MVDREATWPTGGLRDDDPPRQKRHLVATEDTTLRTQLNELSHRLLAAIQSRDVRTLDELLADDFQHFDSSGARLEKEAFIAGVVDARYQILSIGFETIEIAQVDQAAVVVGIQRAEVQLPEGSRVTSRGGFTDVFTQAGDSWVIRLAHSVDL